MVPAGHTIADIWSERCWRERTETRERIERFSILERSSPRVDARNEAPIEVFEVARVKRSTGRSSTSSSLIFLERAGRNGRLDGAVWIEA